MAVFYLDPTGNGSPFNWSGSYANVDDGIREPTVRTSVDSLYVSEFSEDSECRLTYTTPTEIAGTITRLDGWQVAPSGRPDYGIILNGTDLGLRSSISTATSNSWYSYAYTGLSVDIAGATFVSRHVCSDEEDDEIYATYIAVTYTPSESEEEEEEEEDENTGWRRVCFGGLKFLQGRGR